MPTKLVPALPMFLRVFRSSSAVSIFMRAYFVGVSFLITIILANFLGPETFGRYSLLMSIAILASGLSQAGAVPLIVRETAKTDNTQRIRLSVRFTLTLVTLVLTLAFVFYATFFHPPDASKSGIAISYAISIVLCVSAIVSAAVRGMGHTLVGQFPDMFVRPTLFLIAIGIVAMVSTRISAENVLFLHVLAILAGLAFISAVFLVKANALSTDIPFHLDYLRWIRDMGRIASVAWLGVVSAQVVVILTAVLADTVAVAGFRVAVQFSMLMAIGLSAVEAVQAPRFALLYQKGALDEIQNLVRTSSRLSLMIAVPVGLFLITNPETLLALFFSPEYVTAAPAIRILALGQIVNASFGSIGIVLVSCGYESMVIRVNAIVLLVILIASIVLIPAAGLNGAAIAVSLSLALRNVLFAFVAYRKLGVWPSPFMHLPKQSTS